MSIARTLLLTAVAMLAFAGNSLLCRIALRETPIDPTSFTSLRIIAGALTLWLLVRVNRPRRTGAAHWLSACALFAYAIAFSLAYVSLSAATGALLLFGAVQVTMIGAGLARGERFDARQWMGFATAIVGLGGLLIPGVTAPPLLGASLMIAAGVAWGIYSLRGRAGGDPTATTAGNFMRAVPLAIVASVIALPWFGFDVEGALYALASGALASGIGYAIWYAALPALSATSAATVQLSVPVIAAFGGVVLLDEPLTSRLSIASVLVLGGIALVISSRRRS